jgi:hypothetical protein
MGVASPSTATTRVSRVWMTLITLTLALGLVAVTIADEKSRQGYGYTKSSYFFWAGVCLIFVPAAFRLLMKRVDRRERLTLMIFLGISLYVVKILGSPSAFTFSDEYIHLRNTQDILRSHHLFSFNPLLPTAAYYPGLAAITAGLVGITGLSTFSSGLIVIGLARVLFVACFFLIAERITRSDRAAAGAGLVYIANPMFLFWSAAFSYENLALPLAAFVIWWLSQTRRVRGYAQLVVAIVAIGAVTVTHHVVGFALAALLDTWWLVECFTHRPSSERRDIGLMALLSTTTTLLWFFLVAKPAPAYLFSDNFLPAFHQTVSLIFGHLAPRHLYASGGLITPEWESILGFVAVGILLLALPFGIYVAWSLRDRAAVVVALGIAVLFPLSLIPRLAPDGVNISGRSSEYVFAGVGCVLGLLVTDSAWRRRRQGQHRSNRVGKVGWRVTAIASVLISLVFVGEITIGTPFYELMSESSHPRGFPWQVQPDAVSASKWSREHLGINRRFASDKLDSYALATYGAQNPVDESKVWPIFFATSMNKTVVRDIKSNKIQYLFVNWQMTEGVPPSPGYYFSFNEPGAGDYKKAFSRKALKKFSMSTCIGTSYHQGSIEIFNVSRIESGSCIPRLKSSEKGRA